MSTHIEAYGELLGPLSEQSDVCTYGCSEVIFIGKFALGEPAAEYHAVCTGCCGSCYLIAAYHFHRIDRIAISVHVEAYGVLLKPLSKECYVFHYRCCKIVLFGAFCIRIPAVEYHAVCTGCCGLVYCIAADNYHRIDRIAVSVHVKAYGMGYSLPLCIECDVFDLLRCEGIALCIACAASVCCSVP